MKYKIEIWQHSYIIETYESNDIDDVLKWYKDTWYWIYENGNCAYEVYENDRQLSFNELCELRFE